MDGDIRRAIVDALQKIHSLLFVLLVRKKKSKVLKIQRETQQHHDSVCEMHTKNRSQTKKSELKCVIECHTCPKQLKHRH